METQKEIYNAPMTTIVEVKAENIICQSNKFNGFGGEDDLS